MRNKEPRKTYVARRIHFLWIFRNRRYEKQYILNDTLRKYEFICTSVHFKQFYEKCKEKYSTFTSIQKIKRKHTAILMRPDKKCELIRKNFKISCFSAVHITNSKINLYVCNNHMYRTLEQR